MSEVTAAPGTGTPTTRAMSRAEAPEVPARLADEDATYWFLHRGLGWSVVLQLVWVFDGPVQTATLTAMNRALSRGVLHRHLIRAGIPGARPRWTPAASQPELGIDDRTISADRIDEWAADEMATVELDPESGRCWRMRVARCDSGDTAISLCALHLVADGRTMVRAAADAMARAGTADPDVYRRDGHDGPPRSRRRHRVDDVIDAARQVGRAAAGIVRAINSSRQQDDPAAPGALDRPVRAPMAQRAPQARWARATAAVPAHDWDRVAAECGGTANSLYIAVVTGLLRSSGYAPLGDTVKVGVPVDIRSGADDTRANATAGVSIMLTDDPLPAGDLGPIRRAGKMAYQRLSDGRRPAMAHLYPLVWLLPANWVTKVVTAGSGMPDAVVSNLGDLPPMMLELDGCRARRSQFRGVAQGVDAAMPHRFGDGVQSWLVRTPDRVTFSVFGCDEERFESDERLRNLLEQELSAWSLPYEVW
ncbi:hypothetical protein V1Y59_14335 [Gordonia sp. PKS22-38]|uniref:Condensation domain-containing protein n=1 Tax=Gordonia prachuapensis TaxID=3115651 RepID=A0ABU7MVB8_9ACTN|nr:hypothetical protein [Gordonia sp. PKS22-38]